MTSLAELDIIFEPLYEWPGRRTQKPERSRFSAPWANTLYDLRRELEAIDAHGITSRRSGSARGAFLDRFTAPRTRTRHSIGGAR